MSKIILNKKSPGDSINSADLNDDLNQFGSTNLLISSDNIREQGLDYYNFKRGVLSHPKEYVLESAETGLSYSESEFYQRNQLYNKARGLGALKFGEQSMGEKINFNLNDYIYRLSFQGYFYWSNSGDINDRLTLPNDFTGGISAFLKVGYQLTVGGSNFTDDVTHLERGLVFINGGTELEYLGHARFMCTIVDKLDEDWFASQVSLTQGVANEILIIPRIEFNVSQSIGNPREILFKVHESPLHYIQKFRK
jgi:hypothetical protein